MSYKHPEFCYVFIHSMSENNVGIIKWGETGYYPYSGGLTAKDEAVVDHLNDGLGVSKMEAEVMQILSMGRLPWDEERFFEVLSSMEAHQMEKYEKGAEHLTYGEFCRKMSEHNGKVKNRWEERITGVIVMTVDSFDKYYPVAERAYAVSSDNKAWYDAGGYSIYGSSLEGNDNGVRLERCLASEHGGADGWKVAYCFMTERN